MPNVIVVFQAGIQKKTALPEQKQRVYIPFPARLGGNPLLFTDHRTLLPKDNELSYITANEDLISI